MRIYTIAEIERRGLGEVLREAAARVQTGTAAYGITLDLDAIDPQDAPGVTTPVAGGLRAGVLLPELAALAKAAAPAAIEIVEYEPHRDRGGATARLIEELASAMLGGGAARSVIELERRYSAANYDPLPVVLARGEGVHVWDQAGRRYLDMMSAYSAVSLGHGHPRIVRALTEQAKRLAVTSRAYYNDRLPPFLERLCRLTGMDRALPVNTGLEAVETALKAARKWAHKVKRVPEGRAEIIACEGNFHGRSITITGMSSEAQYRDGFGPFPRGFKQVPLRRSAGARARDHARHRRVPGRAGAGRARHRRAAGRATSPSARASAASGTSSSSPTRSRPASAAPASSSPASTTACSRTGSSSARRSAAGCCRCRRSSRATR